MVKNKVHESGNLELEGTPLYTKIISARNRLWSTITGAQQYRFNLMLMNSRRRKLKHISLIYTANPGSTISMSHSVVDSLIIQEMRHWPQSQHFSDPEPYLKIWSHIWRCQDIRKSLSSLYYTRKLKSAHIWCLCRCIRPTSVVDVFRTSVSAASNWRNERTNE